MARKKKTVKKNVVIGVEENFKDEVLKLSHELNITISGLGRMALKSFLEDECNEPICMMNFIELTQQINGLRDIIPENDYANIQQNIGNIMKIKGGK